MKSIQKGSLALAMIATLAGVSEAAVSGRAAPDWVPSGGQCLDDVRTTTTGHTFVRDYSVPAFGESWRDPSGMIWSTAFMYDGNVARMSQPEAEKLCLQLGARLPSATDYERLPPAASCSCGVVNGEIFDNGSYRPQILPRLDLFYFWTSTVRVGLTGNGHYYFMGATGEIGHTTKTDAHLGVRCVIR